MRADAQRPRETTRAPAGSPRFYSVAQVADILGMSAVTVYRAIREGELSALRIRGRVIVPAAVIEAMATGATGAADTTTGGAA